MLNTNQLKDLTNLLSLTWNGDDGMIKHCLRSSKYIQIDNMFVEVCNAKPSITKTLWYDDETTGPEANFENFKRLNERNNMPKLHNLKCSYDGYKDLYFSVHYYNDKTGGRLASLTYEETPSKSDYLIRKVTEDELTQINEAIEEVRTAYTKRLETYYKKYSKNVRSEGYWVNR